MLTITTTDRWQNTYPGAIIGVLEISGVNNTQKSADLDALKRKIEFKLRTRYDGYTRQDFLSLPAMAEYSRYYKQFNKTYHVQLQLESIVLKGKNLPNVSPAVDANFMAEVETLVLTAGHDASKLHGAITFDISQENDSMVLFNGEQKIIRAGDMIMRDEERVCCSIIYGQDNHSPIANLTSRVLYVSYAPPGVPSELVDLQLTKIEIYLRLISPGIKVEQQRLLTA